MARHQHSQVRRRRAAGLDEGIGGYLDPATGEVLPTWDQALDAIGPEDEPWHVARFGDRFDAQGVLAGSKDASRCIGYLTKYLTKQVADCHQADTDTQRAHAARLAEALRYHPCSPTCANWLRYGIQPKNARPGLAPGRCKGKAHDPDHLGYAGRRVLVSRKWSGKSLADSEQAGSGTAGPVQGEAIGHATGTATRVGILTTCLVSGETLPDMGFEVSAPTATRTRDLLLSRHSRNVARGGPAWPDVPFSCSDYGWTWPGVAQCLRSLAPRLAPRDLVSGANVRMLTA